MQKLLKFVKILLIYGQLKYALSLFMEHSQSVVFGLLERAYI